MLQYKNYYMPGSEEELFRFMESSEKTFDIISGGTDLYAKEKGPGSYTDTAVDISGIAEFSAIRLNDGSVAMGANTRIQQFLEEQKLIENVPIMRHAAIYFADQQIREIATIGGNLANASPTGDMIPPLMAMDAVIHAVRKEDGRICRREIPVSDFIEGVGKTSLLAGEVIRSVVCPIFKGYGCAFKKVGLRRSLCISTVNSAFLVKADKTNQYFQDVRIAFGGIGPAPTRLKEIENRLKGERISRELILKIAEYIPNDIVQSRSRREYRKIVVRNFLLAGLLESLAEIDIAAVETPQA